MILLTRKGYINLAIPKTLADDVDNIVDKKVKGYSSRAEFVKDAIRQLLEKMS